MDEVVKTLKQQTLLDAVKDTAQRLSGIRSSIYRLAEQFDEQSQTIERKTGIPMNRYIVENKVDPQDELVDVRPPETVLEWLQLINSDLYDIKIALDVASEAADVQNDNVINRL